MASALRYITSASRYHPRYQSISSMYIRGLILRNFAELAEAFPIAAVVVPCEVGGNFPIHKNETCFKKKVSVYDQEIPQSQTADNHMAPRGRAT